jgi:hypothetical protein
MMRILCPAVVIVPATAHGPPRKSVPLGGGFGAVMRGRQEGSPVGGMNRPGEPPHQPRI